MQHFIYYADAKDPDIMPDAKMMYIRANITSAKEMFDLYKNSLNMPSYFGCNWNALDDCLMDMSFLNEKNVVIIHQDVPFANEGEKKLYIETLFDTVTYWWDYPEHKFFIFFPEKCRTDVIRIVDSLEHE